MKILFVCLGNICRSPMAEAVLSFQIQQEDVASDFLVDSAGTGAWHAGEAADSRTLKVLKQKGIPYHGRARQITQKDFLEFDAIYAMDSKNYEDVLRLPGCIPAKVFKFDAVDVADPYYGGADGFTNMYRIIDYRCRQILDFHLKR